LIFVYGNRNYGRIVVREKEHNITELYRSEERGYFRAFYVIDYNHTNILVEGFDGLMHLANLTFDAGETTNITYKRIFMPQAFAYHKTPFLFSPYHFLIPYTGPNLSRIPKSTTPFNVPYYNTL
jgi:hypothetical protein